MNGAGVFIDGMEMAEELLLLRLRTVLYRRRGAVLLSGEAGRDHGLETAGLVPDAAGSKQRAGMDQREEPAAGGERAFSCGSKVKGSCLPGSKYSRFCKVWQESRMVQNR